MLEVRSVQRHAAGRVAGAAGRPGRRLSGWMNRSSGRGRYDQPDRGLIPFETFNILDRDQQGRIHAVA